MLSKEIDIHSNHEGTPNESLSFEQIGLVSGIVNNIISGEYDIHDSDALQAIGLKEEGNQDNLKSLIKNAYESAKKEQEINIENIVSEKQSRKHLREFLQRMKLDELKNSPFAVKDFDNLEQFNSQGFISINFDPKNLKSILENGYKNDFFTEKANIEYLGKRILAEKSMGGLNLIHTYGAICTHSSDFLYGGVCGLFRGGEKMLGFSVYGDAFLKLKSSVNNRSTGTAGDSYGGKKLLNFKDAKIARNILSKLPQNGGIPYVEAQIYGEITNSDIEGIYFPLYNGKRYSVDTDTIQTVLKMKEECEKNNIKYVVTVPKIMEEEFIQEFEKYKSQLRDISFEIID